MRQRFSCREEQIDLKWKIVSCHAVTPERVITVKRFMSKLEKLHKVHQPVLPDARTIEEHF